MTDILELAIISIVCMLIGAGIAYLYVRNMLGSFWEFAKAHRNVVAIEEEMKEGEKS